MSRKSMTGLGLVFLLAITMILTACGSAVNSGTKEEAAESGTAAEESAVTEQAVAEEKAEEAQADGETAAGESAETTETDETAASAEAADEKLPGMNPDALVTPEPVDGEVSAEAEEQSAADQSAPDQAAADQTETDQEEDGVQGPEPDGPNGGDALSLQIGSKILWKYDEADNEELCEVTYPSVRLTNDDEMFYGELENKLEKRNAEWKRYAEEVYAQFCEEAPARKAEQGEYFGYYTDSEKLYVARADSTILSLGSTYYMYAGGAHGMYGYKAYNYDAATGKSLSIRDVASDYTTLVEKLVDMLHEKYPDLSMMDEIDMVSEGYADNLVWTLGYDGIRFYFDPYALASYAEGAQKIFIPFAGNEGLFKEKYLTTPDAWGIGLPDDGTEIEMEMDPDGDGTLDVLRLTIVKDNEYDQIDGIAIDYNGKKCAQQELWSYGCTPTLIRTGGKLFLYLEMRYDNDYRGNYIFALSGDAPEMVEDTALFRNFYYDEEAEQGYTDEISDPEYICFDVDTDLLSTLDGYVFCSIGSDGRPVPEHEWYTLKSGRDLTLKKELTLMGVTEEGQETQEYTLPAGEILSLERTDNSLWTDAFTEDGHLVRITLDSKEWPRTIGGTDIEEIFDGMMYAG